MPRSIPHITSRRITSCVPSSFRQISKFGCLSIFDIDHWYNVGIRRDLKQYHICLMYMSIWSLNVAHSGPKNLRAVHQVQYMCVLGQIIGGVETRQWTLGLTKIRWMSRKHRTLPKLVHRVQKPVQRKLQSNPEMKHVNSRILEILSKLTNQGCLYKYM